VLTNAETGKWFVVRGNGLVSEIKATLVSGTIYEFVAIEAGQPFVLEDAAGNVIVRDRGVIRHTAPFDTLGDGRPERCSWRRPTPRCTGHTPASPRTSPSARSRPS
jgi:hypothetical protein